MFNRYPTLYVFCTVDDFHALDATSLRDHSIPSELLKKENLEKTSGMVWSNLLQQARKDDIKELGWTLIPFDCSFPNDEKKPRQLLCVAVERGGPVINHDVAFTIYGRFLADEIRHRTTSTESAPRIVCFVYNLGQPMSSKEIVAKLLTHSPELTKSIGTVSYVGMTYDPESSDKEILEQLAKEREFKRGLAERGPLKPFLDDSDEEDAPQVDRAKVEPSKPQPPQPSEEDKKYKILGTTSAESHQFLAGFGAATRKRLE